MALRFRSCGKVAEDVEDVSVRSLRLLVGMKWIATVLLLTATAACTSLPAGALPLDMNAEAHEREASEHERLAASYMARYDRTGRAAYGPGYDSFGIPHTGNPTRKYLNEAKRLRELAAAHRAAAHALRQAEEAEHEQRTGPLVPAARAEAQGRLR